jgi:hypothetical protein
MVLLATGRYTSANGAEYESQGQAQSAAERVAPGCNKGEEIRPERPKYQYYALQGCSGLIL